MSNGYDLMEMVQRYWYLNGGGAFQTGAFKVAGVCFAVALIFGLYRREQ